KCEYMMDKVGETFSGVITGVTSFGLFVELNDIYVEGLVHITALSNDYYQFDPVKHSLIGERTRRTFRLADQAKVRVVRVDLDEKRMDFDLVSGGMRAESDTASAKGRKVRSKSKKHRGKGAAQSKVHDRKSKTRKKTAVGKKHRRRSP
ncbi:MAG: S1 RNA-binding domain-containing protein, partial [Desulfobacterales bacterium]